MTTFAEALACSRAPDTIHLIVRARREFASRLTSEELCQPDTRRVQEAIMQRINSPFQPTSPLGSEERKPRDEAIRREIGLIIAWLDDRGISPEQKPPAA